MKYMSEKKMLDRDGSYGMKTIPKFAWYKLSE